MTQLSESQFEITFARTAAQSAMRLEFEHNSQLDSKWNFEPGTERMMCGLVCLKSVIDYYSDQSGIESPDMDTLVRTVKEANDPKENGTSHAVQVDILKSQGLVAWRRNWDAPSSDTKWLVKNERYLSEQISAIDKQTSYEYRLSTLREQMLVSITNSLAEGNPVIASVQAGFDSNRADHQIVITGKTTTEQGEDFVIMDPIRSPGSSLHTVTVDQFFDYFNNRAIFTKQ